MPNKKLYTAPTQPAMPAVKVRAREPTVAELAQQIAAVRDDLAELSVRVGNNEMLRDELSRQVLSIEMRVEQLEVAASRMRYDDRENAEAHRANVEAHRVNTEELKALRALVESSKAELSSMPAVLTRAIEQTATSVQKATAAAPWSVGIGIGAATVIVTQIGSCYATKDIAQQAADTAVRNAPTPNVQIVEAEADSKPQKSKRVQSTQPAEDGENEP